MRRLSNLITGVLCSAGFHHNRLMLRQNQKCSRWVLVCQHCGTVTIPPWSREF